MKKYTKKLKLNILSSRLQDYRLYHYFIKRCLDYNTGDSQYEAFLGYLRDEITENFKNKNNKEKDKIIKEILTRERKRLDKLIRYNLRQIKEEWPKICPSFVDICEKKFDGCPFPEGKYTAIMTIWGRYPYIKSKKIIYFPAHKDWMLFVIIHELLHLVFFNFYTHYCKDIQLSKDNLWELSEVLDVLVMNEEPYLKWVKMQSQPYPAHRKNYELLLPFFKERKSMHSFIAEASKILNKQGSP